MDAIRSVITNPWVITGWLILDVISLGLLLYDLKHHNPEIMSIMKFVWVLTVLYSGPLGLCVYAFSGRKQIAHDSLWRKSFRSVAHCYSGCGAGEVTGVIITAGLLRLGNWWISGVTFVLAYVAGFTLTMIPLRQDGEGFGQALKDAVYSETASIAVMEIVAISVDMFLGGKSTISETLFWSSLVVSLSLGLVAAYPVNVLLIHWGVKAGMHSPKEMAKHAQHTHGESRSESAH
jgi:hypothetical protein